MSTEENVTEVAEYLEMMLGPVQMDDHPTLVLITLFYGTVLVTGILGNISVCIVIFRSSHLHTAMNYYLVSLALADLMIITLGEQSEGILTIILHPSDHLQSTNTRKALNPFSIILPMRLATFCVFSLPRFVSLINIKGSCSLSEGRMVTDNRIFEKNIILIKRD